MTPHSTPHTYHRFRSVTQQIILLLLIFVTSVAARSRGAIPLAPVAPPADVFTASNATLVWSEHLALDITLDFDQRRVRGTAQHRIINPSGAREFILDTRDLDIASVAVDGSPTGWRLGPASANGQALTIDIEPATRVVRINYQTRPSSSALRWFTASQTKGRVMPSLFTQGQPDHARSWIPVQDSPAVRMAWSATVRVPPGMLALMSARNPTASRDDGVYTFEVRQSVPAYLIVVSAGRFAFRSLDARTGIYAEPELLDDAVYEMQFLPRMFDAAERVLGPYPWDRYDLLFPPHFGGGMENTNLNFISPDHITGNRVGPVLPSGLIAHEIAHSWTGDMVTCATWSDLWLNEGSATYYEKRILEEMEGTERSEVGYYYDRRAYEDYLRNNPRLPSYITTLHRQFQGEERPGNAFNIVSYQKGELFLKMLEDRMGRSEFDSFVSEFLRGHAYRWADEKAFLTLLRARLASRSTAEIEALKLEEWIYGSGLPANVTAPNSSRIVDRVALQAEAFNRGTNASQLSTEGWTALEFNLFLQMIEMTAARMPELDSAFGFSSYPTPHIRWLLAIAITRDPVFLPVLEAYLLRGTSGSLPLWYELGRSSSGRQYAIPIYQRSRDFYSDSSRTYIEQALRLSSGKVVLPDAFDLHAPWPNDMPAKISPVRR